MKKSVQRLISVVLTLMLMMSLCAPIFNVSATEELTKVEKWNLILGDEIGAEFHVSVSDTVSADAVMYVTDGYGTSQYALSEKDSDGNYVFAARLAAAQLADTITLQLHDGETLGPVHSYKATDYAAAVMEGNYQETTKALVKAMLNYGAAAQNYFDYKTDSLANAGYEETTVPEIPAVDISNMVSGSVDGISYYGASLVFQSKVAVRFYFTVSGDINSYTFSTGSTPVLKNGKYYVEVADINPQDYENEIQLTVNDSLTVTYSPLTYISRKAASDNTELAALVASMYNYHLAAEKYVPETPIIDVTPALIDSDDFRTNTDKAWMDFGSEYTGNFTPADENSGVWFDGEKMAAPILQMNEWYTTYCSIYLGTVTEESTLKIDGVFANEDGTKIRITDFNLKRVDGKWELDNGDAPEADPIEVTPTLIDSDDFRTNTDKVWMDMGAEYTGNFTPADENSGVWFDGEKMAAPILQMNEWYTTYCSIYLGTVTEESTLKIDGIFVNEDGLKIRIIDFKVYRADGKWEIGEPSAVEPETTEPETTEPEVQIIDVTPALIDSDDFRTNADKAWMDFGAVYTGNFTPADDDSGVWFDGEKMAAPILQMNEWYTTYCSIYLGTVTEESTLKIDGIFVNEEGTKIRITDFNLKRVDGKWELEGVSVPFESTAVTLAPHNDHNNTTTIYVTAESNPASNFEAYKNLRPVAGNGTVSLNDVVLGEGADYAFMTAYQPNTLYSIQLLNGRTWNMGDQLTISGQFAYDGSSTGVTIAAFTMWYDGSVWTTEKPLQTPGDLNYDGDWTSADLELLQSYIDQGIADEYSAVADLNGDNAVNSDDATVLQSIINGESQVIDGKITTKYRAGKKLNIFADGPVVQSNEDLLKAYFNAGFTTLIMTEDYTGVMGDDGNTSITKADGTLDDDYKNCIVTALKYGDVMVRNHSNTAGYFTESLYSQLYDLGVRQFYIWDEPNPQNNGFFGIGSEDGDIPTVAALAESFETLLPADALFHVNLLPSYGAGNGNSWVGKISYTEYVDQYVSDVVSKLSTHEQTLSVDNYPLLSDNTIRSTYLRDLWYIGNKAKAAKASGSDITVNYCIQAYADSTNDEIRAPETRADISFQTNTGLALGAESFEYFEYYDYDASTETITGIVHNGLYEAVKSINKELNAWDHIFLSFDWQGVKTYNVDSAYTSGVTELSSLQGISGVTATAATLVGEYKYGDAAEYAYMITNFTEPSQGTTDTVTLTLSANQEVLVYADGIGRWLNADENGTLTLTIPAGGGVFVIPQ